MTKTTLTPAAQAAAIVSLCLFLAGCRPDEVPEEPGRPPTGLPELAAARWIEPRLTGASRWGPCTRKLPAGRVIEEVDCPSAPQRSAKSVACDEITTHEKALRALISQSDCTGEAVERLEALTRNGGDARVWSDLAAGFLEHAERSDDPVALLHALDSARRAVEKDPRLPEARFNLALAQEALGFLKEAQASWDQIRRTDRSPWAAEAAERRQQLARELAVQTATQWPLNRQRLPVVVGASDQRAVSQLIAPFPAAAQREVEAVIFPRWAEALGGDRPDDARRQLALAAAIAVALHQRTGDRYLLEAVKLIEQAASSPGEEARLAALGQGHLAFGRARLHDQALAWEKAEGEYQRAEQWLARAGSPLRGGAIMGRALALARRQKPEQLEEAFDLLAPVAREARERGYWNLWGRVQANRAYIRFLQSRHAESLDLYESARGAFERNQDRESLASTTIRQSGLLRLFGDHERAWRAAFQAQRHASYLAEVQSLHYLLGETATVASELGHPHTALLFQTRAVVAVRDELARTGADQRDRIAGLRGNLSMALHARADFQLRLGQHAPAQRDLTEAIGLATADPANMDASVQLALLAQLQGVQGQVYLQSRPPDPRRAIAAFTDALRISTTSPTVGYHTFRATLFIGREEAHRMAGEATRAKRDLTSAIAELREEGKVILAHRERGSQEELWTPYFLRFQETYRQLIGQLAGEGSDREAFAYAEKARAFEPLELVRRLDTTPEAFNELAQDGEPLELVSIQACLPRATFLLEYTVLKDSTLVWIVSRHHFEMLKLPVRGATIEAWANTLQRGAENYDLPGFEEGLYRPYAELLAAPLAKIATLREGQENDRRLVFVPDGAIHGLPFAALRERRTSPYVVQDFTVSVAASATLYVFSLLRDEALSSATAPRVLLVGDPAFQQSEVTRGLRRLPHARAEVEDILPLYRGNAPRLLVDRQATAPAVFAAARDSSVVHLAVHAVANRQEPFRSLLLLAPTKEHSGLLFARDLVTELRLERARLVVLSACSSAGGHAVGPEGLAALVRPFLTAGVPAVAGNLWEVGDAPARTLLVRFHVYYRGGHDAASALRQAQLDLLEDGSPAVKAPVVWGPFQVVGHARSPFTPENRNPRREPP